MPGCSKHSRQEKRNEHSQVGNTGTRKDPKVVGRRFFEDTQAFLDYYYFIKAKENEIWVIEEEEEIQS